MLRGERKRNHIKCSLTNSKKREEDKNRNKEKGQIPKTVTNVVNINPTLSVITLNVSGLHVSIKRQIVKMDQKPNPTICY